MLFLQIAKHTAESCPMHNEKTKKLAMDLFNKTGALTKKYGVKVVGSWISYPEHFMVSVFDAPNMDVMLKMSMEPEVMAFMGFNMTDMRPVMTLEEAMKQLMK